MKRHQIKKRPLSDTVLENLEPEEKEYKEKDSGNLYFRVKPSGAKGWVMRYKKANGKWNWHGLGGYPAISGAKARTLYREKLVELANGATELTAKQQDPNAKTFRNVAMEWYNEPKIQRLADSTKASYSISINHACERFGDTPITDITRAEWLNYLSKLQDDTKPNRQTTVKAKEVLAVCSRIYKFAIVHEIASVENNPLEYMRERLKVHEIKNYSHVSNDDLPKLLKDIAKMENKKHRLYIQILMHVFTRPSELVGAYWKEIDFNKGLWEIPAERMKKKRPHIVPLSKQVIALLEELRSITGADEKLFPSRAKVLNKACEIYRVTLNKLGYNQTLHGFRHIASTTLNNHTEDGFKFDGRVIETALAHKQQGVAGIYNKAEYLEDRRELHQWYSDYLDSCLQK